MRDERILITGGAGFIGSHLVRLMVKKYPHCQIFNLDKLTYAGHLENVKDLENAPNYKFIQADIADGVGLEALFRTFSFDHIIHLAAESHVDRSILGPMDFVMTNVVGTVNLLNAARKFWGTRDHDGRFLHVSTDEVYGSLGKVGQFTEKSPINPHSPYAASKASSDMFVRAFSHTYGISCLISNCSNNFGPYQHPEKLIPLTIYNLLQKKQVPIYGKGENVRDWLFVEDHVLALEKIFSKGKAGETYNIGGENEWKNIDLVKYLCQIVDNKKGNRVGTSQNLIAFVPDRKGHDERYAIDCSKIRKSLGWKPLVSFEEALNLTVDWYLTHRNWMEMVLYGSFEKSYV